MGWAARSTTCRRGVQLPDAGRSLQGRGPRRDEQDAPDRPIFLTALSPSLRMRHEPATARRARVLQIVISRTAGSRRRRSPGSEVTTCCPVRRAQITTWASTMSDVPLAASSLPTLVASTRPRSITSVVGCRTRRASRAWRSGRRTAWASAVAGTVTRAPVSRARARRTTTRRSFRSRAIRPPASRVTPGIRPPTCPRAGVTPSASSAQARSLSESEPPVSCNASASNAPQPATSSRETPTACCTNPETLGAIPASTRERIRSSCASSRVIVTFFDAIPVTIPARTRRPGLAHPLRTQIHHHPHRVFGPSPSDVSASRQKRCRLA